MNVFENWEVTNSLNIAQIKDEIRMLNRIDKIEICRWLEAETTDDLVVRIGMDRARNIRQEFERSFKAASPERQAAWGARVSPK
jgi:hypothetical protein